ncbi:MAG TPA: D-sedoheptulose 7-phosphate isomerase [Geobacteraceae bacterium]|nr:D-sedoheptulose 7-phosphate isomerase [Geobacteraceae bacterium]
MEENIRAQLQFHREVIEAVEQQLTAPIAAVAVLIAQALAAGKKLLVMGNGGSAADAQHFAAEIVGRFRMERRGLPAIALTTDTSLLTALANDYGFDAVFRRQVEALANEGDVVIGISTSGSSANVRAALLLAREMGCRTVGLLGGDGGTIRDCVEFPLVIPCRETPRIQEGHITIIHIICDLVEKQLFARE